MKISASNKLRGKITEIIPGSCTAKVKLDLGYGNIIFAIVTIDSIKYLKLKVGDVACAMLNPTQVVLGVEED